MSTAVRNISSTKPAQPGGPGYAQDGRSEEEAEYLWWRERSRVVLTPTSAPSAMGLFGFSAATLIVAGDLAGWYGTKTTIVYFAPFCLAFGGIGQFLAGMWAYKARDTLATVAHSMWGTFWIGFGILWLLVGAHVIPKPPGTGTTHAVGYGMWFVALALLTGICALVALAKNVALFMTLGLLATGSALVAAGEIAGAHGSIVAGGWVLVASVGAAIYTATALLLADTYGRVVLPVLEWNKRSNVPGRVIARPIEYTGGMPGSRVGQ